MGPYMVAISERRFTPYLKKKLLKNGGFAVINTQAGAIVVPLKEGCFDYKKQLEALSRSNLDAQA